MSDQPRLRIHSVADLTGVAAATLRAWEKRYGVPNPVRTQGAYRLYTHRDVERVQRMQALCEGGMMASEAADLVRHEAPESSLGNGTAIDGFAAASARIVKAARRMDASAIEEELAAAAALGSASEAFRRVLTPALVELGALWRQGKISIGHEHLATGLVTGAANQWLRLIQPRAASRTAVLACFAEETHSLPLYGIGFHLAEWGCRSAVLGAKTPPSGLKAAVQNINPCLVGLSVTLAPKLPVAEELLDGYADAAGEVPWVVGGAGAEPLRSLVEARGGHIAPFSDDDLHELFKRLLTRLGS